MAGRAGPVDSWLAALPPDLRAPVDALRAIVRAAAPELVEEIKWNAPSFRDGADHRVTLGLERTGGVRMVLHRGVGAKRLDGWSFDDPDRLASWPAPDRGVIQVADAGAIAARRGQLVALVARWIAATRAAPGDQGRGSGPGIRAGD
ncbi:DUF1801 domain-containing protein [Sphingomonas sp.]|uniref:DUF1801 domain-containing protein n=1 Tax=Sphingomonas sp. TaxID=28214 RepID=UPI001EB185E3|nr:DUF1801 domain-containing protein [Sphingomonas sp.]MBX3595263.1 DUF1801 domain-containing protein [Sphingomonas sp.]